MTEPQAYELLTSVFHRVFERSGITLAADTTARDVVGWDSLKQVEIVMALEESMNVTFSTRELDSLRNVGDFARLLMRKADLVR